MPNKSPMKPAAGMPEGKRPSRTNSPTLLQGVPVDFDRDGLPLAGIEEERDRLLTEARERAEEVRRELTAKARAEAEREVKDLRRDWQRQRHDAIQSLERNIVEAALSLARRVLAALADQAIESKLQARLLVELDDLAAAKEQQRRGLFAGPGPVRVLSAAPSR